MKEERTMNKIDETKSKHKPRRVKDIAETEVCNRGKISRKSPKKGERYSNYEEKNRCRKEPET